MKATCAVTERDQVLTGPDTVLLPLPRPHSSRPGPDLGSLPQDPSEGWAE